MKQVVDLFTELSDRLRTFGEDAHTRAVADRACAANGWFTPSDVHRSIDSLVDEMLCRERLEAWLAAYEVPVRTPREVLVVVAGNIPLVGFFDLLCVVAAGHRCLVKPSAKDRVLMEYVVEELLKIDPEAPVALCDDTTGADAVIATGSDNANRYFRARYAGIPTLLRGSRRSVAVLSGRETSEQLAGLSDDIWAYSGLGCRNVSLVFAPDEYELKLEVNAVNPKYTNNYIQSCALRSVAGLPFFDLGGALAVEQWEFPAALSEIAIARYRDLRQVEAWLAERDAQVQCVVSECIVHPRGTGFGRAQSPALTDYPDGRDVMAWLAALN